MILIWKYFRNNKDYINIMKVCKKYETFCDINDYNPINDTSIIIFNGIEKNYLFPIIKIHHFYEFKDMLYKKEWNNMCIGLL